MKKTAITLVACLSLFTTVMAQKGTCTISGKLNGKDLTTPLHLKNITGADLTIPVNADGSFSGRLNLPEKGFYTMTGVGNIYLEPGYELQISLAPDSTYQFRGKGSLENTTPVAARKALSKFIDTNEEQLLGQEALYMPVKEFIGKIDAFVKDGEQAFSRSGSPFFREMAGKDLAFYGKYVLSMYNLYYGTDLKKQAEFYKFMETANRKDTGHARKMGEFHQRMRVKKMDSLERITVNDLTDNWDKNDVQLFKQSSWYRYMLNSYLSSLQYQKYRDQWMAGMHDDNARALLDLYIATHELKDPFILGYITHSETTSALKQLKDKNVRDSLYKSYTANVKNPVYLAEVKEIYNNANNFGDNTPAPDFSYEDVNGKKVSLHDLRGKYVYIDVWATWCGPCKMEIPHLEKIETAYHGKNIHFVSLSVDKMADKQKWKDFVQNGTLKSIQVLADKDFSSDFIKKFNINSIPRFILIAPDGKIVSANALRPSNAELKVLLDKLLSKG